MVGVDVVEVLEVVGLPGMYGAGTSPAEPMATASRAQRLPWFEVDAVVVDMPFGIVHKVKGGRGGARGGRVPQAMSA